MHVPFEGKLNLVIVIGTVQSPVTHFYPVACQLTRHTLFELTNICVKVTTATSVCAGLPKQLLEKSEREKQREKKAEKTEQ